MSRSAVGLASKMNSWFEEGMRCLRNVDVFTSTEERDLVLADFMNCLRTGGYSHKFRMELLNVILTRKEQMEVDIREKEI